jgi:N-terminal domain of galactosyltransferase
VEGTCVGEWSKGQALADAATRAAHGVLVLADADSIVPADTLTDAVARVAAGAPWVMPHRKVYRLSEAHTARVYAGAAPEPRDTCRAPYAGVTGGGITVLSRATWDTVGGIDPRFVGWGGEDIAFGWALETLCGPGVHLAAPLFHLWHTQEFQGQHRRGSPESEALAGRYRDARGRPDKMRALIAEHAHEAVPV